MLNMVEVVIEFNRRKQFFLDQANKLERYNGIELFTKYHFYLIHNLSSNFPFQKSATKHHNEHGIHQPKGKLADVLVYEP